MTYVCVYDRYITFAVQGGGGHALAGAGEARWKGGGHASTPVLVTQSCPPPDDCVRGFYEVATPLRAPAPQVDRSLAFSRTRRVVKSVGRQPFHAP